MKSLEAFAKKKPWEVEGVEWREVRLGEICIINPKKSEVKYLLEQNIDVSFIPMDHVDDTEGKIIKQEIKPIQAVYKGYTYFKNGDILFAKITPCMENGKSAVARNLANGIGFGSTEFHVLRPKEGILSEFIFYFIRRKRFRDLAKLHFTGTVGHKRVPKEFLINSKIPIPFRNGKPDLETQKKIVEYIEANFSRIDKILEKKKKELEQLDELWESVLEEAFKPKEGEEWREVRLGEVAKVVGGSTAPQDKKFYKNGKYLFVRVSDLGAQKNFKPLIDTRDKLNEEGIKRYKLVLVPKDTVVFPKSGAAILTNSRGILGKEAFIVNHLAGVIAIENKSYPRYLLFYLSNIDMKLYISPDSSYPSLKLETIKNLKLPLPFRNGKPDLEKQKEIANYLDSVYEKIKTLKEKIQNQITQLEEMKESILDEVFSYGNTG